MSLALSTVVMTAQTFTNVAASANLDLGGNKDGGHGWADFNNDGCLDVLINTNDGTLRSRLYQNNCDDPPTFTDVTASLAPSLLDQTCERSAVWADFNNDGYIDFARNRAYRLEVYMNRGPSATPAWSFGDDNLDPNYICTGLSGGFNCEGLAWADYNEDGFLDIYLENHNYGFDILRNPGDCTANFYHITPNSDPLGLPTSATDGDYMASCDYDQDGWVDILARKRNADDLFHNDGGTFSVIQGIDDATNGNKGGVLFADFDNDGDFDIFWTSQGTNQIWEQTGLFSGNFVATGEPSASSGIGLGTGIDGCTSGDIDNDGDQDLFLTDNTGASYLFINSSTTSTWSFTRNNLGIDVNGNGEGCSMVDYDKDGDLDIYVNRKNATNQLWQNSLNNNNYLIVEAYLDLQLDFARPDHGATCTLYDATGTTIKSGAIDARSSFGHGCQNQSQIHFGLPDGPDSQYELSISYTRCGGMKVKIDTLITPSALTDQLFRYTNADFGSISHLGCNALPIELSEFTARNMESGIQLDWITLSETNNEFFTVERSRNGIDFIPIGKIDGAGNSFLEEHYSWFDHSPNPGLNYYRIKQTDFDGKSSHSPMRAIEFEYDGVVLRVFPNPLRHSHESLHIWLAGLIENEKIELDIFTSSGELVWQYHSHLSKDIVEMKLARNYFDQSGVFVVHMRNGPIKIIRKIVVE